ncbi:thioredoxin family protein [Stieleria varia]|nr:thioredoxin family protein [Stieleria varia]
MSPASGVQWHDNLEAGWRQARQLKRPMVIFITSRQCIYCDAMKRDTWCDQSVTQQLRDGYVAIRLTPEHNAETLSRIKVPAYPTTLIGLPEGKVVAHRIGYQPANTVRSLLGEIANSIKH